MKLDNRSIKLIEKLKPAVEDILKERPYHIQDLVEIVNRPDCDDYIMQNIIAHLEYERRVLFLGLGKGYMIFQTPCGPVKHRVELSVYCSPEFMENLKTSIFNALKKEALTGQALHDLLSDLKEDTYYQAIEMIILIIVHQLEEDAFVKKFGTKTINNVSKSRYYKSKTNGDTVRVDMYKAI